MGEREVGLSDAYQPPIAGDAPFVPARAATPEKPFYVVSTSKLLVLFFTTLGSYQLYWFYKHWKCHAPYAQRKVSPFWRAVFAIFFTHTLFSAFQMRAAERQVGRPLKEMATLYVVLTIASRVLDRLVSADTPAGPLDLASMVIGLSAVAPLVVAQRVANAACDDPEGATNERFTAVNYVFMGIGSLLWLGIAASLALPVDDPALYDGAYR